MNQPRYQGQPVYFSDVVVRKDSPYQTFEDLRGATFAYNEPGSVSGYWTMRYHLATIGAFDGFFGRIIGSGGHVNSLKMILAGEIDTAAIDSTVLDVELAKTPELADKIRIVEGLGPTPIPPWVVRRSLPEEQKRELREALVAIQAAEDGRRLLDGLLVGGFSAVSDDYYDPVRGMLAKAAVVEW
jgi:phosphonate transport system substrate-binding protein